MSMDINIVLLPETESVYLVNGEFFEGDAFVSSADEVVYITVLPLDARFMPYTVKLVGGKVACNESCAAVCKTGEREFALKLGLRYGFVFSGEHKNLPDDVCCKFFYYVKGKHFDFAFEMLSRSLSGLSERDLGAFFNGYVDIFNVRGKYYLADETGAGHECVFALKDGKIDNISIDG